MENRGQVAYPVWLFIVCFIIFTNVYSYYERPSVVSSKVGKKFQDCCMIDCTTGKRVRIGHINVLNARVPKCNTSDHLSARVWFSMFLGSTCTWQTLMKVNLAFFLSQSYKKYLSFIWILCAREPIVYPNFHVNTNHQFFAKQHILSPINLSQLQAMTFFAILIYRRISNSQGKREIVRDSGGLR